MSMNTKKNVAIVLLVVSMLLWVLRKLNVLYIPGLSMILLAGSMIIVGIMMFQLKQKKKQLFLEMGIILLKGVTLWTRKQCTSLLMDFSS